MGETRSVAIPNPFNPTTYDQLIDFANRAARSNMVPNAFKGKPDDIIIAVTMGAEIGLKPNQALQSIAVINGRPSVWGDALLALIRVHPEFEDIKETIDGDGANMVANCTIKRRGSSLVIYSFSVDDAKKAGLWNKQGPWQQYPKRMLQMRARGFASRDAFPDALRGLITAEEAHDMPQDDFKGTTIDATRENASTSIASAEPATQAANAPDPAIEKERKIIKWLSKIEERFIDCASVDDIEAIIAEDNTQRALAEFIGGNLNRLTGLIETARAQFPATASSAADAEIDDFPGIDPLREAAKDTAAEIMVELTKPNNFHIAMNNAAIKAKIGKLAREYPDLHEQISQVINQKKAA
jgi:RecT family